MPERDDRAFLPRRILEILQKHEVDFVLIGAVASGIHGAPFSTIDVDIVPALETSNLDRLARALDELGAFFRDSDSPEGTQLNLTGRILKRVLPEFRFLRFDTKYGFLDVIHRPAGTKGFRELAAGAVEEDLGSVRVLLADLEDIIRSKQAVGRPRDLQHLPTLRRLLEIKREEEEE